MSEKQPVKYHVPESCNHCGYEFDEDETWYSSSTDNPVHTGDGDTSDLQCPSCKKKIFIMCVHNVALKAVDENYDDV